MDIYSAALRLTRPYVIGANDAVEGLPIAAHGVIGDGHTAALVRVDGAIDWLCMPRFDSPSVFGQILDAERGGVVAITPAGRPFESLQRYDPDTNVLETMFRLPEGGIARVTDYMPWTGDPRATVHEIHRRIDCIEGRATLCVTFDPRFGYGSDLPRLDVSAEGVLAVAGSGERLACACEGLDWRPRAGGGLEATMTLKAGERRWLVLSWDAPRVEPLRAYRPYDHLRATRRAWREWSRLLRYEGPWRHHVLRAALVLKLMIYAPTGAMVAAATTSLPEKLGGVRNWDYRYSWPRDAALAVRACNEIGFGGEAREFFHFVRDALDAHPALRILYSIDGRECAAERVLDLRGHRGAAPVRVGNAARDQLQLDNPGYLLDAAWTYERNEGTLGLRTWRHLAEVTEWLRSNWRRPDHGIWEPRDGVHHHVHSRLMSWVAFDRAIRLARRVGGWSFADSWGAARDEVRAEILRSGLDPTGSHFVGRYGARASDATALLLPVYGFLPSDDPRIQATLARVRSELGQGGFLYRYYSDDGLPPGEGAFILCGFWEAEALAIAGRLAEAQEVFLRHAEASNHLGLLSEEIDPTTGELLGNFPQAFSHMGLIVAATRIDRALRMRDEGVEIAACDVTHS
jgi:GH15 family glucan-1,4-alpha-glucosidase